MISLRLTRRKKSKSRDITKAVDFTTDLFPVYSATNIFIHELISIAELFPEILYITRD